MHITAIVPAFNERKNIKNVIDQLQKVEHIKQIIVINDGSTDDTDKVLTQFSNIQTINNSQNLGKTASICKGVEQSKYDNLLLVDADLFGLNEYYILSLIEAYKDSFDMAVLDYGGQEYSWAIKLNKIFPVLSGVRLIKKELFLEIPLENEHSIDSQLNKWFIAHKKRIAIVPGEVVQRSGKWEKYPFIKGVYLNSKIYRELLLSYSLSDIPKIIKHWKKIDKDKYISRVYKNRVINVSAIIPAYNEEKNISKVLNCLKLVPEISEIIVIDDGSTDKTSQYARSFEGVKVVKNKENLGKTRSVIKGIGESKNDTILMLDADLVGLEFIHLEELINTYKLGFDMVILDYGNQEFYLRKIFRSFPALSGVRILSKQEFKKIKFELSDRFELENRINSHYLNNEKLLIVVNGDSVYTPHKFEKYSFHKGLYLEAKALKEIFLSEGATNIVKLVRSWWDINARRK